MSPSNAVLPAPLRYGAYICLRPVDDWHSLTGAPVEQLLRRLEFQNEFDAADGHPPEAFAFLRRVSATTAAIADIDLIHAQAIVHVASQAGTRVPEVCGAVAELVAGAAAVSVLSGVVRPPNFTGGAMHEFAYAPQVRQQPGEAMPHAFLVPMRKTPEWWGKTWMERHTYFLPRYDDAGRMLNEGHALAAAAGIPHLLRRTYKHVLEPAPEGAYDFVNYFECADSGVPVFREVCAALRDVARNPEWRFVREGPTWHGRRVRTWSELQAPALPR